MKTTNLKMLPVSKLINLKRNPQFLTPKQMDSLKASIQRDGFVVPILVRPIKGGKFEVVSGNHRFMAAVELKFTEVPCVVSKMSDDDCKRLAVNLNSIHGEPNPEILAPFLADMSDDVLAQIHIEDDLKAELLAFDKHLEDRLASLEPPDKINSGSPTKANHICVCPKCNRKHLREGKNV